MNTFVGVGRLTKDVEVKNTNSGKNYANFTIAINRPFKDANGERIADFINCVAWGKTAEFVSNYFSKGSKIGVTGMVQTRSFDDQNGQKRYVTEIVVNTAEFVEDKGDSQGKAPAPKSNPEPLTPPAPIDEDTSSLPFEF